MDWKCGQAAEYLLCKHKTLSSKPSTRTEGVTQVAENLPRVQTPVLKKKKKKKNPSTRGNLSYNDQERQPMLPPKCSSLKKYF
jgi:hypothetical protein